MGLEARAITSGTLAAARCSEGPTVLSHSPQGSRISDRSRRVVAIGIVKLRIG